MLPYEYPKWQTVYFYFSRWKRDDTLEQIQQQLVEQQRRKASRPAEQAVGILDAQSTKTTLVAGAQRGFDAGKKAKGRKRHLVVDTLGLILTVVIQSASVQGLARSRGSACVDEAVLGRCQKAICGCRLQRQTGGTGENSIGHRGAHCKKELVRRLSGPAQTPDR